VWLIGVWRTGRVGATVVPTAETSSVKSKASNHRNRGKRKTRLLLVLIYGGCEDNLRLTLREQHQREADQCGLSSAEEDYGNQAAVKELREISHSQDSPCYELHLGQTSTSQHDPQTIKRETTSMDSRSLDVSGVLATAFSCNWSGLASGKQVAMSSLTPTHSITYSSSRELDEKENME